MTMKSNSGEIEVFLCPDPASQPVKNNEEILGMPIREELIMDENEELCISKRSSNNNNSNNKKKVQEQVLADITSSHPSTSSNISNSKVNFIYNLLMRVLSLNL